MNKSVAATMMKQIVKVAECCYKQAKMYDMK